MSRDSKFAHAKMAYVLSGILCSQKNYVSLVSILLPPNHFIPHSNLLRAQSKSASKRMRLAALLTGTLWAAPSVSCRRIQALEVSCPLRSLCVCHFRYCKGTSNTDLVGWKRKGCPVHVFGNCLFLPSCEWQFCLAFDAKLLILSVLWQGRNWKFASIRLDTEISSGNCAWSCSILCI